MFYGSTYRAHLTRCAVQSQKAVTAYFSSKQLLPFGFAERRCEIDSYEVRRERDGSVRMTLTDRLTDHRLTYLAACWPAPCNGVALGCSRLTGATYCLTDRWRWLLPSSYTVWHMVGVCSVQGHAPYITHTGDGCTLWIESLNRQGSLQRGTPSHSTLWQEHQSERHLVATRCTIHGGRLRRALFCQACCWSGQCDSFQRFPHNKPWRLSVFWQCLLKQHKVYLMMYSGRPRPRCVHPRWSVPDQPAATDSLRPDGTSYVCLQAKSSTAG